MNIAIREPWSLLTRLSRDLDSLWAGPSTEVAYIPPVDVIEEKDRYVVKADLPGVDPNEIEVTAEKGILTLRGERKAEKREHTDGYERLERTMGSFTRRFALPENVQADAISAKYVHGVLEVSIPKQPEVAARRVAVDVH
jgi:HSP20 family protein